MLHHDLGLKAFNVAENRGDGEHAPIALELQETVLARDITVDRDLVPILGMSNIVDRDVVMLTPEKRHGGERIVASKHVARSGLSERSRPSADPGFAPLAVFPVPRREPRAHARATRQ